MKTERPQDAVASAMAEHWGRLLSVLIRDVRDFQLAEDALSGAFESALEHWKRGVPNNAEGWLLKVARRKAIDQLRRQRTQRNAEPDLAYLRGLDAEEMPVAHEIPDERLRLIFTACHPALDEKTRVALTLRTLCGLETPEIARAFLDKESAMAQRLSRAKGKIARAKIPYVVPGPEDWDARLGSVLTVIYLIFNEAYCPSAGDAPVRRGLGEEAIDLARLLDRLCPGEPEVLGLLALLLLSHARSPARQGVDGAAMSLEDQDRSLWNRDAASEGLRLIETALRRGRPGPFQLQAAVSAIHVEAESFDATNWKEIVLIYARLLEMAPNPVVVLNWAVAVSYAVGPAEGLAVLPEELDGYQPYHAARADMLRRLGHLEEATKAYDVALTLTGNRGDRLFLERRRASLFDG